MSDALFQAQLEAFYANGGSVTVAAPKKLRGSKTFGQKCANSIATFGSRPRKDRLPVSNRLWDLSK